MSDLEELQQPTHAAETNYRPGIAPRKPKDLGGSFVDNAKILQKEDAEHPGRREGGVEAVLRPRERAAVVDGEGKHLNDMKRGELFAAAYRARMARATIAMLSAAGDRTAARNAATVGIREITIHLEAAGSIDATTHPGVTAAFTDAYANIQALGVTLHEDLADESAGLGMPELLAELTSVGIPRGWKAPATREAREAIARKHAPTETSSLGLIITAPLNHARLALDHAVDGYAHKMFSLDADTTKQTPNEAKGPTYFTPAAARAAMFLDRIANHLSHARDLVQSTDPSIHEALHAYAASAQRFVHWAMAGTTPLTAEAQRIADASAPLFAWAKVPALDLTATNTREGDDAESFDGFGKSFETAWIGIFQQQRSALEALADATTPEEKPHWSAFLFRMLANATIGFIIGGPAGAVGAIAEAAVSGSSQAQKVGSKQATALKGGIANGVESLVTAVLTDVLASSDSAVTTDGVRKAFFDRQASAVTRIQLELQTRVHALLIAEARRRPDGAEYLKAVVSNLVERMSRVAAVQQARSVQDWAIYLATTTHGVDKPSGGVDMTGVGEQRAELSDFDFVSQAIDPDAQRGNVASGVLELFVSVEDRAPHVWKARAGLRPDDARKLGRIAIRDLRMPVRFVLEVPNALGHPEAAVVVNRNDKGVLWLRSAGDEGRKRIVAMHGGQPSLDADVLRGGAAVIESIGDALIPAVES